MLFAALRDLQWRKRRVAIAVVGTGLVFALSLVMSGIAASFGNETERTLDLVAADTWVVDASIAGPLTNLEPLPDSLADEIAGATGVEEAEPLAFTRQTVDVDGPTDVAVLGVVPGGLGSPAAVRDGRPLGGTGEAVVDASLGLDVGDTLELSGGRFEVVGEVSGRTLFAGTPNVYLALEDVQRDMLLGQSVANAVVTRGTPTDLPAGLKAMSPAEVRDDALRSLGNAIRTIDYMKVLLWVVAVTILGSAVYLSAMERTRDIAVFKATGTSTVAVAGGMAIQALVLAVLAAALAVVLAMVLAPRFPLPAEVPTSAYLALPVIAVVVGLLASLAGMRRAVTTPPALAFGSG